MRTRRIIHIARTAGALAVAALTAASTVNGYRPLARHGYPSMWSWAFGLVVTELPLQTLASQLGGLALTARRLTRPVRTVAWLVAGLSALGLLKFWRAGHQANVPLTAALDSGLGTDRRTDSASLWRQPAGGGTAKTPGLLRMMRVYRDYAHDADISYGEYGRANHLDIWRRPDLDPTGKAPVLFQIPGGAWITGNKRGQAHPLMSHLAELGWICVAINYRHSPRNTWPDHIVDVKRALAWVKAHIGEYGGDPDFVAITGGRPAAIYRRWLRSLQMIRSSSRGLKTPTPGCTPPCRSTASMTSPVSRTRCIRTCCRCWSRWSSNDRTRRI